MTPYPGTALYRRMVAAGRIWHRDWDRYDTRHVVFTPRGMTPQQLEAGYWRAYRDFYRWSSIWRSAAAKPALGDRLRHLAYAGGWKKFEPLWDLAIRTRQVLHGLPLLEATLAAFGTRSSTRDTARTADSAGRLEPAQQGVAAGLEHLDERLLLLGQGDLGGVLGQVHGPVVPPAERRAQRPSLRPQ